MQACTFHVGERVIAIATEEIREIVLPQAVTRLPLGPALVRGLTHVRGDILVAIDLHGQLDQSEQRPRAESCLQVILTEAHGGVALLVDSVGDLVELPDDSAVIEAGELTMKTPTSENGEVLLLNVAEAIPSAPAEA